MSAFVVGMGTSGNSQGEQSQVSFQVPKDARFRKATRAMVLAQVAVEKAMQGHPEIAPDDIGLVLGCSQGELQVTLEFLQTYFTTAMARPILFQNSLHNSTTGFVAMKQRVCGPLATVSNWRWSGEDALQTALTILQEGLCTHCLAVSVDAHLPNVLPEISSSEILRGQFGEGAGAVLLASSSGASRIAQMTSVEIQRGLPVDPAVRPAAYEANAIELLVNAIGAGAPSRQASELVLQKFGGGRSVIRWTY